MSSRKRKLIDHNPWTFNGEPFTEDMIGDFAGFVYMIICPDGKRYIGRKNFWSMRKAPGAKRRKRQMSDWQRYFSSSKLIKDMVKEQGSTGFQRIILSLHELERDVNYCEVRMQWKHDVLESRDASGERLYLNDNIQGKFYPLLYSDWESRSVIASD